HDGFTLADLVSFNGKHNEANGEDNRDGSNDNASWNCGVEGPTDDPQVLALRQKQIRNFLALLMLSHGTAMLLMGDEVGRSQQGNNNPYCQDNELSWFDWSLLERHRDIHRFVKALIAHRMQRDIVIDQRHVSLNDLLAESVIEFHGVTLDEPDWSEASRSFSVTLNSLNNRFRIHLMVNAYWEALCFELPAADGKENPWHRWIDTALASPADISDWSSAPVVNSRHLQVEARSLVALFVTLDQVSPPGAFQHFTAGIPR
ncbi:MAG: glycogen debranching enzyme, partial [Prochlorococcaceae cyanobacterium]